MADVEDVGSSALERATRALRDEPDPGWPGVADRLRGRLARVSRPGRPVTVADDPAVGTLRVDERVVVDLVRRALAVVPDCRPVGVAVRTGDGGRVAAVGVEVWARYGADVRVVADDVRAATTAALAGLLDAPVPVDVDVVDVEA